MLGTCAYHQDYIEYYAEPSYNSIIQQTVLAPMITACTRRKRIVKCKQNIENSIRMKA